MLEIVDFIFKGLAEPARYFYKRRNASRQETLEIWRTRPELEVVDVKWQSADETAVGSPFDAEGFFARVESLEWRNGVPYVTYRQDDFDAENWRGVVFTLRNVGKTDIKQLCVASVEKREYSLFPSNWTVPAAETFGLQYCLDVDKPIRVGETRTLALRCRQTSRLPGVYLFSVVPIDQNRDRYWRQFLSPWEERATDAEKIPADEYLDETNVERAAQLYFGSNI